MRTSVIIAVLSLVLIVGILVWRGMMPSDPVGLSAVQAQAMQGEAGVAHVTLTFETADEPDVLISASSPVASQVEIVSPTGASRLTIPARSTPSLSSDGAYLRLSGVEGDLSEGRLIPLTLIFLRSGEQTVRARVGEPSDPHAQHMAMAAMAAQDTQGPAPTLAMTLEPAANGATLVRMQVENFTFDPGGEMPEHVPGHGHGHLYLDGLKLQRVYTGEALIGALPAGRYEVRVTLNSNLHVPYKNADGQVSAVAALVVQ